MHIRIDRESSVPAYMQVGSICTWCKTPLKTRACKRLSCQSPDDRTRLSTALR